jgi:hypothetical protein
MKFIRTIITFIYEPLFVCGIISLAYTTNFFFHVVVNILQEHELGAFQYLIGVLWSF